MSALDNLYAAGAYVFLTVLIVAGGLAFAADTAGRAPWPRRGQR
jgi:hypothetical protein